jgi:hypothetical protein
MLAIATSSSTVSVEEKAFVKAFAEGIVLLPF